MKSKPLLPSQLLNCGLSLENATALVQKINPILAAQSPECAWQTLSKTILGKEHPFSLHLFLYNWLFPNWGNCPETAPAWLPDPSEIAHTNLYQLMGEQGHVDVAEFHAWSVNHYTAFVEKMVAKLSIHFHEPYQSVLDPTAAITEPKWFPSARLNIIESCFQAPPQQPAILYQAEEKSPIVTVTYQELRINSQQIAHSLKQLNIVAGDKIAVIMPMTSEAVALYLGIIQMGGVVVSIADSFSSEEIATRLSLANTKLIFTQDELFRKGKCHRLYQKIIKTQVPPCIVITQDPSLLRAQDISWQQFLIAQTETEYVHETPMAAINILFSSGTSGTPKAIPWNHTTPIKVASDAYLHHNVQQGDVIAWPTSLGWMMGPWLIFASLLNQATIALYGGTANEKGYGAFIQDARVTLLGVVPTLVAQWRESHCMEAFNWQLIKAFTSTGECSHAEDMFYLMYLAGYKPIIEYCGGTEIGGGYVSSTVIEKNYPSLFSCKVFGLDFILIDEEQCKTDIEGEVALLPPAIGLSTELLHGNHQQIYYQGMPRYHGKPLRRHGDLLHHYPQGLYAILGRTDDTMNLGGIKTSSAEIERTLTGLPGIKETAAIAIQSMANTSLLIIYAVTDESLSLDKTTIKNTLQARIAERLNPLFKIFDVVLVTELPKTASNKIMRRILRDTFQSNHV